MQDKMCWIMERISDVQQSLNIQLFMETSRLLLYSGVYSTQYGRTQFFCLLVARFNTLNGKLLSL